MVIDNKSYATVEHYFYSQMFLNEQNATSLEYSEVIRKQSTPNKARILAKQFRDTNGYPWRAALNHVIKEYREAKPRSDWEEIKESVMREGVYAKFTQNPKLGEKLLSTEEEELLFNYEYDDFWGTRSSKDGKNKLGEILMEVRREIANRLN